MTTLSCSALGRVTRPSSQMSVVPVAPLLLWWTADEQVAAVGPHTEAKA